MSDAALTSGRTRPAAFPANWTGRIAWIGLALYTVYATSILNVTWARFVKGLENGEKFLARMFPPNTAADKLSLISDGMIESLQIAVLATFFG
ncbi:MAG: hypothetical protein ACRCS0_03210, partial [Albidovulum sp.]